ncbi:MAG: DUF134 domain-containing protein [Bacteroidales bacterium]|nr:DUF134 domain-containing protein [Bacteroidales bacterium]HOZ30517.1 DUF134 domain-containing protein [Bacteroidales bacterium]
MSPRRKRMRRMMNLPLIKGFKPYGQQDGLKNSDPVILLLEEYESVKLCDYEMHNHISACEIMGVSRPTFTRIYASARQKIATALAEGRQITIEGGRVTFDKDWYLCQDCKCYFSNPELDNEIEECPLCKSKNISYLGQSKLDGKNIDTDKELCVCPLCGYSIPHLQGKPCKQEICPDCKVPLKRNNLL